MRSLSTPIRLLGGLLVVLIASVGTVGTSPRAGQQNPAPPGGRANAPGRGGAPIRDLPATPDAPAGTASIVGRIVVSGTGAPARRARVSVSGEGLRGGRSALTDDQGRYALTALPAGRFTLSASKIGHLNVSYGQRVPGSGRPGTPIQLGDGQRLTINLQIPRGGVISGTILDEHGDAVPGTQVRAFRYSMQSGVRTLQSAGGDATDDRGIYRIYGLQLGDYLICATPRTPAPAGPSPAIDRLQGAAAALASQPGLAGQQAAAALIDRMNAVQVQGGQPDQDETTTGYAPVYFPGTPMTSNATPVTLTVGEERLGVDFQLQLVAMARIEGTVINPVSQEPGGVQTQPVNVQLINVGDDVGGIGGSSARADRDGKFRFNNVAPGQYTVVARTGGPGAMAGPAVNEMLAGRGLRGGGPGGAPGAVDGGVQGRGRGVTTQRLWATMEVSVDGRNISNLVLTLQPGFAMSGRLEFRGTTLQAPSDLTRIRVSLSPADQTAGARGTATAAAGRVDDSGRFTIDGVVPGRYRLSAGGATGWSIESAVVGGQDALDFPLDIRSSQNLTGAVVTFTDQQTSLAGVVTNPQGQAVSDYTLIVYPTDQKYWLPQSRRIRSIRPATDGAFTIVGLPPGDYRLAPVLDPEPGSWYDTTFLQQLDSGAERFSVTEGEKKVQNVRVGT
jgi:Carboxypeptidase regulatory-like domain